MRLRDRLRLAREILSTYAVVRWWLMRLDFPEAVRAIRNTTAGDPTELPHAVGVRLGGTVQKMLRLLPFDSRCLVRSLVLERMLARRGVASSLIIGVRSDPTFSAHAWVEHAGMPFLPTDESFHRLTEI